MDLTLPVAAPAPAYETWPTAVERTYLRRGLDQPGGKLPLFDRYGQRYPESLIQVCLDRGWAEPWFRNPTKPDWLVCRLTPEGRAVAQASRPAAARR